MSKMTEYISPMESMELISEHLGISLEDLKKASESRQEKARILRLQDQIKAEKAKEAAALEKARKQFNEMWQGGEIIVRCDNKILTKPGDICKNGTPDQKEMDHLVIAVKNVHGHLVMNFKGGVSGSPLARRAATLTRSIPCTCEKGSHQVEVFITSNTN